LISVSNIDVSVNDTHGRNSHDETEYPNLDGWFAAIRDKFGQVTSVYYDEDRYEYNSLSIKKTIAGMLSMYIPMHESEYDHKEITTSGSLVLHYKRSHNGSSLMYHVEGTIDNQRIMKHLQKVIEFGEDDNLKSVAVIEDVMGSGSSEERGDFIALSGVHSEAVLRYVSSQTSYGPPPNAPQSITTETLSLVQSVFYTPLTQSVRNDIEKKIVACSQELSANDCIKHLQLTFNQFSNKELETFVQEYIPKKIKLSKELVVLFQALCGSSKKDVDIFIAKDTLSQLSSNILSHVIPCLASITPNSNTIQVLTALAFDRDGHSTENFDLSNDAMLALGTTANKLGFSEISSKIVEKLHSALKEHTSKRDYNTITLSCLQYTDDAKSNAHHNFASSNHQQLRHAVLIDSIGNAAADDSLDTIITHINSPHSLTVKHSALRALRHYSNEKVCIYF